MHDFMNGFCEPAHEAVVQTDIWENFRTHDEQWGGMQNDPHDHHDGLYAIPYVAAGLALYQQHVPESTGSVLEIGCAQGYILNHVGGPDTIRVGIDFNEDRVRKGREQYPDTTFIVGDVRCLGLSIEGAPFDIVMLPGVIEHVRYQEARELIQTALDLCKPGGKILFDLPWWDGTNFDPGIHQNPCHCWTGTQYRWDWLFRGLGAQRIHLPDHSFYVFGVIEKRDVCGTLVGCWGKIGDIIHAVPTAQKLGGAHIVHSGQFEAVDSILDLLDGVKLYSSDELDWGAPDLGLPSFQGRTVNCSHNHFRKDPVRNLNILDWWGQGYHSIDFHAAWAHETLTGRERYLQFKPGVASNTFTDMVVFLSNSGDPAMRNVSADLFPHIAAHVTKKGGAPVEYSRGAICTGADMRDADLGEFVRNLAIARMLVSVDTLASGILAQSLGVPIVRMYTGHTRDTGTGPPDRDWAGYRSVSCPSQAAEVTCLIDELWNWREENGASRA